MPNSKTTPGPWQSYCNDFTGTYVASKDPTYDVVCHVADDANARLISAAPCLLEALEWYKNQMCEGFCEDLKAEDYYSESMDFHCAGCKARAAISRAKGEA